MKDMKLKDYFNIPNCLSYIRLILLPVFMYLYWHAQSREDYIIAFVVLAVALLTDMFDGFIARRYNMITEWGKMLDPVADKLLQGILAISIIKNYKPMLVFVITFACKEIYMAIMNLKLKKYEPNIVQAKFFGKFVTVIIDFFVSILLLLTNLPANIVWMIILILMLSIIYVWIRYARIHLAIIRKYNLISSKA